MLFKNFIKKLKFKINTRDLVNLMTLFLKLKNHENFFINSFDEIKSSQIFNNIQEIIGINVNVPLPKTLPKNLKKLIWVHNNLTSLEVKLPKTLEVLDLSQNNFRKLPILPKNLKITKF
jgi:Leucine-rich repeat (LRR) protein